MVCAEEIEPDSSPDTHLFWKGCNHVYHRACIVEAKKQGVEGCPRCWELTEASVWFPSIAKAEERATQAAATQVDAAEEEGEAEEEEEESTGCSMGEDDSDKDAVAAEESETQPWGTQDVEAACLGVPKQEKQDFGVPKQDLDARVLEMVEDAQIQSPSPTLSPRAAAPEAQPEPAKPKGKKRRGGALATAGPAPEDQPEAALPPAPSAALVQAPSADQLVEHRQVRCWLCTRLFNLESEELKSNDSAQKHKCKTCCKVDTASRLI